MKRIVDHLRQKSAQRFVGREAELSLFRQSLEAELPPWSVFLVHGPGGVGKTTLLERMREMASEARFDVVRLDARDIEPSATGVVRALGVALAAGGANVRLPTVLKRCQEQPRRLLMIDTLEHIAHLALWLRDEVLANLPSETLVVLAGRTPPDASWRTHDLWRTGSQVLGLRNLGPQESLDLAAQRGLSPEQARKALDLSYGHPLTLTLLTDLADQREALPDSLDTDLIRQIMDCFVAQVPSPLHREALEVCAHARSTTQDLIAHLVDEARSHELFAWLASLSFMQSGPKGLFPHDLVRDAVVAELAWRHPERSRALARGLQALVFERLRQGGASPRSDMALDLLFLQRGSAVMRQFVDFGGIGEVHFELACDADLEATLALTAAEMNEDSARLVQRWHGHPHAALWVLRDLAQEVVGAVLFIDLARLTPDELASDPGLGPAHDWIAQHAPVRGDEQAVCSRMAVVRGGTSRSSAAVNAMQMCMVFQWLSTPKMAVFVNTVVDLAYWQPLMEHIDFALMDIPPFEVAGIRFDQFIHDWRRVPPDRWLTLLGQRAAAGHQGRLANPHAGVEPVVVLSRSAFDQAVRDALRHWGDTAALPANPLMRSRMVLAGQGTPPAALAALRRLLEQAHASLLAHPRDLKFHKALDRTYFRPAGTQEQIAERLGLPYGTYRYQLGTGIERVVDWLWQQELA